MGAEVGGRFEASRVGATIPSCERGRAEGNVDKMAEYSPGIASVRLDLARHGQYVAQAKRPMSADTPICQRCPACTALLAGWLLTLVGTSSATAAGTNSLSAYSQAPECAEAAARGRLPALDERLPARPLLVRPVERIGRYGGTWHLAILSPNDTDILYRTIGYENLVSWDANWTHVVPNVAEAYTVSPDAKEYTFRLRKGMRWSDGAPFTVDDILFWFEDVYSVYGGAERQWLGRDLKVERVDGQTVRFRFDQPHGLLLEYLASPNVAAPTTFPKHYLQQFHPRYRPDAERLAREAGFASAAERLQRAAFLFSAQQYFKGKPTLGAWVTTNELPGKLDSIQLAGTRLIAVRNPYYWKIDPAGQQLPYLDRVEFLVASNPAEIVELGLQGKLDMQYFYLGGEENRQRFETGAPTGGFRLFRRLLSVSSAAALSLNLNHPDPELRRLFNDRNVRVALSIALDRARMAAEIGLGLGQPYQLAPRPESPFYDERLAHQHTEYDPARAARLLDEAGLARKDAEGFRLRADGSRLRLRLSICDNPYCTVLWREVARAVAAAWSKVGVETVVEELRRQELYALKNDRTAHDAVIWEGEGGSDPLLETRYYLPTTWESNYGIRWYKWWAGDLGAGEEPPAAVKRHYELFAQLRAQVGLSAQKRLMRQILELSADQFYAMGICLQGPGFGVVRERFRNVPLVMPSAWSYPSPGPTLPCQYFLAP